MTSKFIEILNDGVKTIELIEDKHTALTAAKLIHGRLANEIIRFASSLQVSENGSMAPTSSEELLKI
jgi:hypothetical protein